MILHYKPSTDIGGDLKVAVLILEENSQVLIKWTVLCSIFELSEALYLYTYFTVSGCVNGCCKKNKIYSIIIKFDTYSI